MTAPEQQVRELIARLRAVPPRREAWQAPGGGLCEVLSADYPALARAALAFAAEQQPAPPALSDEALARELRAAHSRSGRMGVRPAAGWPMVTNFSGVLGSSIRASLFANRANRGHDRGGRAEDRPRSDPLRESPIRIRPRGAPVGLALPPEPQQERAAGQHVAEQIAELRGRLANAEERAADRSRLADLAAASERYWREHGEELKRQLDEWMERADARRERVIRLMKRESELRGRLAAVIEAASTPIPGKEGA